MPSKESDSYAQSDAELSESFGSEDLAERRRLQRKTSSAVNVKKFQFDLDADFPSLSEALVTQSRPMTITHGFAPVGDHAASSQENVAADAAAAAATSGTAALKRRRKRHPCQRVTALNVVRLYNPSPSLILFFSIHFDSFHLIQLPCLTQFIFINFVLIQFKFCQLN